jgi:hypothetical protein
MHTRTRLVGAAMVGAVLLPIGASSTAFGEPASAGAPTEAPRACSAELPDDPTAATNRFMTLIQTLERQGLTEAEIDAKLAADYCLDRVDGGGEADTRGNPDEEIALSKPKFYKIKGKKNQYFVKAAWKWLKIPKEVKGYDAFGLSFSKRVSPLSHVLQYRGNNFGWKKTSQAETSSSYGSGFIFNEGPRITSPLNDMQGLTGEIGITFKAAKKGCSNHQAFSKYGHTWKSTNVTGIGIGSNSISFAWSSSSNKWQQASQPSSEARICRR